MSLKTFGDYAILTWIFGLFFFIIISIVNFFYAVIYTQDFNPFVNSISIVGFFFLIMGLYYIIFSIWLRNHI